MKELKEILNTNVEPKKTSTLETLQKQADTFNESNGTLNEFDCHICNNKGFIQKVVYEPMYKDYILVVSKCECMKKRAIINKAKNSGLGDYVNKRFDDFIVYSDWQKDIKSKALEYVKSNNNNWFITTGQSGCGKTLISCIIASYLLFVNNQDVLYITWTDFISKLKRDMMGDNSNAVSEYLDSIKNVDVLYIDELLKKYNDTDLKYIIEIINYRYTNNKKTIISSERLINELLDIDEATFGRVIEKSDKYIINIPRDRTKNYRLKGIIA